MKFIVDAHLPKKLSFFLLEQGHDSVHTLDLPNKNATKDSEINQLSLDEKRVLISKDLDFIESLLVSDKPYKLAAVATGNISNKKLLELFHQNIEQIIVALEENRLIEINTESIIIKK